jgi:exonuclease V gamma subunit
MQTELRSPQLSSVHYDTDYLLWVEQTLAQLKAGEYSQVDWTNLFEEIEDMSRRQRDALESNLIVVLVHLLKWQFQPEMQCGSWKGSIREHRRRIHRALLSSPSLRSYLTTILDDCYRSARSQASDETGLDLDRFPESCEYAIDRILDDEYLPDSLS